MLVPLPVGLFVCATIFDIADLSGGPALVGTVGYWTAVAGLTAVVSVASIGMADLWDVPRCPARRTVLTVHAINLVMALLFVLACLVRVQVPDRGAGPGVLVVELLAVTIGAAGVRVGITLIRQFDEARAEPTTFDSFGAGSEPVTGSFGEGAAPAR